MYANQLLAKLLCVFISSSFCVAQPRTNMNDTSKQWIINSSTIFQNLMKDYDPSIAPFTPDKPVQVALTLEILAFGEVKEAKMEYGLDLYFLQAWTDIRLAQGQGRNFEFSGNDIKKIWTPDTYFMNAKKTEIKNVMKDNQMVFIMPNGLVVQMSRITLDVACHMELQMYPFDRQKCELIIESFSLTESKLNYSWGNLATEKCVVDVYDDAMAQYEYKGVKLSYKHKKISSAAFSNLYATFVFDRRTSYTVLQVYVPSYMIVLLSFMALWIPKDAVPARVALGITTVLTIVYFLGTVNSSMPRVSYMKAIDCHLFVSFGFVFATMLEYIIVLNISDRKKRTMSADENFELGLLNNLTSDDSPQNKRYQAGVPNACFRLFSCKNKRKKGMYTPSVNAVDRYARVLMPSVYGIFVLVYWVICALLSPQKESLDLC
ncbi:gamma-aminobutyric acid receptor subunit rho-1-like isoform X2 [Stylophora pistillata]|uniref:gamma-aminobutyric acid receptor subunit rho-1-like isoform X2 n=1 Tax=Stylophora pistillata TaxID=50429 RepID=UPI000C03DEC7|nr:gamma-aminobutyric acid receptor subunit rho-1-like isoform X2 [Stylophora pistillata]